MQKLIIELNTHINIIEYEQTTDMDINAQLRSNPTNRVWWLGTHPKNAGWSVNWQPYKLYKFEDAIHFISDDLATISSKMDVKRQLWQIIQVFFK